MTMIKAELLAFLQNNIPGDARITLEASRGFERGPGDNGFMESKPNGTMSIRIEVAGGTRDTEVSQEAVMARLSARLRESDGRLYP